MRGGSSQNDRAIFADEGVEDFLVGAAGGDAGAEFIEFTGGAGAAYVVAFAEDLRATASAHEAVAEVVVAGTGVGSADGEADGDGEAESLGGFDPEVESEAAVV